MTDTTPQQLAATRNALTQVLAAAKIRWNVSTAEWETPGYLEARQAADALLASNAVRPENKVRADELQAASEAFGVDISTNDGEWFKGYRQAQREIIQNLAARAAAVRAGGES